MLWTRLISVNQEKVNQDHEPERMVEPIGLQASVVLSQLQVKLTRLPASVLQHYIKDTNRKKSLDGDAGSPQNEEPHTSQSMENDVQSDSKSTFSLDMSRHLFLSSSTSNALVTTDANGNKAQENQDLRVELGLHTELDIKLEPGEELKEEPQDPVDHDHLVDDDGLLQTSEHVLETNDKHIHDHEYNSRLSKKQRKRKSKNTDTNNQNKDGTQSKIVYTTRARKKNENKTENTKESKKDAPPISDVSTKPANDKSDGKFDDWQKNTKKCKIKFSSLCLGNNFSCTKCMFTTDIERVFKSHVNAHSAVRSYACDKCPYITTIETNLVYHIRRRHTDYVYACKLCGKKYTQLSSLNRHFIIHTGEKSYKSASTNSNNFIKVKRLSTINDKICRNLSTQIRGDAKKKHDKLQDTLLPDGKKCSKLVNLRTHSGEKQYACKICDKKFIHNNALSLHIRLTHKNEKACKVTQDFKMPVIKATKFTCSKCKYTTNAANLLKSHLQAHSAVKKYTCDTCSYIFKDKYKLIRHLRQHTGEKPYACKMCHKKFIRSDHLTNHIKVAHTFEYLHVCKICDRKFSQRNRLNEHVRTHTGEKPYSCKICSKKFNRTDVLDSHIRLTHKGEKMYGCEICSKKFGHRSYLKIHIRTHTGEKPYACTICDKKFRDNSSLYDHKRLHTGEKPHACNLCDMKFITSSALTNHLRTHTGEKPYSCKICSREFARTITLKNHMIIHTGGKPFACNLCDKKYRRKSMLKSHIISTHA